MLVSRSKLRAYAPSSQGVGAAFMLQSQFVIFMAQPLLAVGGGELGLGFSRLPPGGGGVRPAGGRTAEAVHRVAGEHADRLEPVVGKVVGLVDG
jgi:hypothetical protein